MAKKIENIRLISITKEDPKELDNALAKLNSNKIIKGAVKFWNRVNQRTGRMEYCYNALSRY